MYQLFKMRYTRDYFYFQQVIFENLQQWFHKPQFFRFSRYLNIGETRFYKFAKSVDFIIFRFMYLSKHLLKQSLARRIVQIPRASVMLSHHFNQKEKKSCEDGIYFDERDKEAMIRIIAKLETNADIELNRTHLHCHDDYCFIPTSERIDTEVIDEFDESLVKILENFGVKNEIGLMKSLNDWKHNN